MYEQPSPFFSIYFRLRLEGTGEGGRLITPIRPIACLAGQLEVEDGIIRIFWKYLQSCPGLGKRGNSWGPCVYTIELQTKHKFPILNSHIEDIEIQQILSDDALWCFMVPG